jgi:hypothetical protein
VNELLSLLEIGFYVGLVVAPALVLNRLLAGAEGATLADLFAIALDPPLPRGVQYEEPERWQVERLRPRHPAETPAPQALTPQALTPRQAGRPAMELAESRRCA